LAREASQHGRTLALRSYLPRGQRDAPLCGKLGKSERNVAESVRARLRKHARDIKQDFNLVLTRYAIERLLYRVSISTHADKFLLKGALLFDLWFDIPHRPTRDIDVLVFGASELPHLENIFKDMCAHKVDDGVIFLPDSVHATAIRADAHHTGARVVLLGIIDSAQCHCRLILGLVMQLHQGQCVLSILSC